jgi:hypothetical protein
MSFPGRLLLAATLCAAPGVARAQSYEQLRLGVRPLPMTSESSGARPGALRKECRSWVGWGAVVGTVAGAVYGIASVNSDGGDGHAVAKLMSPVIIVIPTLAGWAAGSLGGYVLCRLNHPGGESSDAL